LRERIISELFRSIFAANKILTSPAPKTAGACCFYRIRYSNATAFCSKNMLTIRNLHVNSGKKEILKGITLHIKKGETHFLMGPNGAGKSTLGMALMGHPDFDVTKGTLFFNAKNITRFAPEERAKLGLFLAFQHPLEFEGIRLYSFLRNIAVKNNKAVFLPAVFYSALEKNLLSLGMGREFAERYLNLGFSGGEKKKTEILQLLEAKPKFAILDEIDSGLDAESLLRVTKAMAALTRNGDLSLLVITHNARTAKYLPPRKVHVMVGGRIIASGERNLINKIDKHGYKIFK